MLTALILCAALASGGGDTPPASPPAKAGRGERQSLEQFLDQARQQRQAVQEKLEGNVTNVLKMFDAFKDPPGPAVLSSIGDKLVALGPEAAPLLVKHLDPGDAATDKERSRSIQIALALGRMDTSAITDQLLAMLSTAKLDGKRNALRVLEKTPDKARVQPVVEALFKSSEGTLRQASLRTLITLGGTQNDALLTEVLASTDDTLVGMALVGLAETRNTSAIDKVRAILADSRANQLAVQLLGYFKAVAGTTSEADIVALMHLAQGSAPLDVRIAIVEALPALGATLNTELRRTMQPITESTERKLSDAGMVAMVRMGDKASRKDLLKPYDERIADNERWAQAWVDRGDVYARIGEDDNAIKDFQKAIVVGKDDPTFQPDAFIKLARALAREGKLKEAADKLRVAPVSLEVLRGLRNDPDFKKLRESKYGKDVFGTD